MPVFKFVKKNFLYIVILLWVLLNLSLLRKELKYIMELPGNLSLSYTEAKLRTDGPIYTFSENLRRLTPRKSTIIFLYNKFTHFRKAAYYTYPRMMVPEKGPSGSGGFLRSGADFLAVYMPGKERILKGFDSNPKLEKIYAQQEGAVYRIK